MATHLPVVRPWPPLLLDHCPDQPQEALHARPRDDRVLRARNNPQLELGVVVGERRVRRHFGRVDLRAVPRQRDLGVAHAEGPRGDDAHPERLADVRSVEVVRGPVLLARVVLQIRPVVVRVALKVVRGLLVVVELLAGQPTLAPFLRLAQARRVKVVVVVQQVPRARAHQGVGGRGSRLAVVPASFAAVVAVLVAHGVVDHEGVQGRDEVPVEGADVATRGVGVRVVVLRQSRGVVALLGPLLVHGQRYDLLVPHLLDEAPRRERVVDERVEPQHARRHRHLGRLV
mmetsp:Transcript_19801/g.67050  ORF Transcript_19801/g.67050 Transcript_19801/m.67050 type:complete len:287 (-) Transcript_19801:725-1585(-)